MQKTQDSSPDLANVRIGLSRKIWFEIVQKCDTMNRRRVIRILKEREKDLMEMRHHLKSKLDYTRKQLKEIKNNPKKIWADKYKISSALWDKRSI